MKRKEYHHIKEDYEGMEDIVNEVAGELIDESKQHRVVSLWGVGGLGKTSLAWKIYMDKRVRDHFEYFAWTCVSQDYQVDIILREILKCLDPQKGGTTKTEVQANVYKILREKRCLVILDNIWTNDAWDSLKAALPIKNTMSKILITTRYKEIARYMDPHSFICNLRCLTEEESWELLKGRVFSQNHGLTITQAVEDLGRKIIKQCGYLPLAIIVIGGVLAYKTTMEEWELVHQNIELHLQKGNNEVLELSYNDLPYHLKPCFLYMGNFPEDSWISTRSLVRMWIAEGFVTTRETKFGVSILDVAESYVKELVDRGMVQAREKKLSGRVGNCRLHYLMRDLSIRKALEENFSSSTKVDGFSSLGISTFQNCKMRRLSMYVNRYPDATDQHELQRIPHLRSLIFHLNNDLIPYGERFTLDQVIKNFRLLRVLDMVAKFSWRPYSMSESIGDLIHLRHFCLVGFQIKKLPSAIGNLVLLETFEIKRCNGFCPLFIPNVLWKMKSLREICLPKYYYTKSNEKLRLHCLKNVEILENFLPRICETKDLQNFTKLRKLTCISQTGKEFGVSLLEWIKFKNLQHVPFKFVRVSGESYPEAKLRELAIYNGSCKLWLDGRVLRGSLSEFPPMLMRLDLYRSRLEEDPMPVLEKLPNLVALNLLFNSFVGRKMVCSGGGFPKLTSLTLFSLYNLEEMNFMEGSMDCLSSLEIRICDKLKMVPEGLDIISSSQKLNFTYRDQDGQTYQVMKEEQGWVYRRGPYTRPW